MTVAADAKGTGKDLSSSLAQGPPLRGNKKSPTQKDLSVGKAE